MARRRELADRFWEKVDRSSPDGCWNWIAGRTNTGYGKFMADGQAQGAHRVAWRLATGRPIPGGAFVCHNCDNPLCCRPDHLFLGSHEDNMRDAWEKAHVVGRPGLKRGGGSMRLRSPGKWQLRVYAGSFGGRSRYLERTFTGSELEARKALARLQIEVVEKRVGPPIQKTLDQLIDAWLEAHPPTQGAPHTHINRYIRPELGRIKLSRLDPATIDGFYGRLRRGGVKGHPLSATYVRRIHTTLNVILTQGVKWSWLPRNPAEQASPPTGHRQAPEPPDAGQVRLLLEEAARTNPPLHAYLRVAAACGPRRGELAGLRRSDLDHQAGEIVFRRSIVLNETGAVTVKPYTKTGGQRRVALDPATLTALQVLQIAQGEQAAMFGVELDPDPWLFSFDIRADQPPRPDAFTRAFGRTRDRLGLKVRLHDLRHYHATSLLTAGVDVRTVAGRLGHANASTTLSVYAAWQPAADRKASDIAADLLID